jgi:hypothetical protein
MSEQKEEDIKVNSLSSFKPLLRFGTIHPARKERVGDNFQAKASVQPFENLEEYANARSSELNLLSLHVDLFLFSAWRRARVDF